MRALALSVTVAALGCTPRPAAWSQALAVDGPHRVGGQAMWVDETRGEVFALDPSASPPSVGSIAAGRGATAVFETPAHDRLLVLTPGREATKPGEMPEPPRLTVIAPGPTVQRAFTLHAAFDQVAISPDGALAIAYFGATAPSSPAVFRNPNELDLVDLTTDGRDDNDPAGPNPRVRTIRSLGSAPIAVVFSPPLEIPAGAAPRTLAVVLATGYLTFLDLTNPTRSEITVPLAPAGDATTITPEQVLFATAPPTVYVRADGASDLFALALDAHPTTDPAANDYLPSVNQPSTGVVPRDMITYRDAAGAWVLTADESQDMALISVDTGDFAVIPVGAPVDAILAVPPDAPTTAILFSRAQPSAEVHFVDLARLATDGQRAVSLRPLARPVHDLVAVPGGAQVVVMHDDSRTVVSILDLGPHRTDTPILGNVPLESFDFSSDAYLLGVAAGLLRLGVLDLGTLNPLDVRLDFAPKRVMALDGAVVVDHGAPEGLVTVLPSPAADRDQARVLDGFLLRGILDQEMED
jgi:hypothetical protein